jgi:hypothetical protein
VVAVAAFVQAHQVEADFHQQVGGGLVVGQHLGRDGPQLVRAGVLDALEHERRGQALAALVVIGADVNDLQHAPLGPLDGCEGGGGDTVVFGEYGDALLDAAGELAVSEARLVVQHVGGAERLAQRAFLDPPGDVNALAVTDQVKVGVAGERGVDVGHGVEVAGLDRAELHARIVSRRRYDAADDAA